MTLAAVVSGVSAEPANSVLSAPALPVLDDPLEVDADIDLSELDLVEGLTGSVTFLGQVVGTSTLTDDLSISL